MARTEPLLIFLSYAHKDFRIVRAKIINSLKQCRIWWDSGGDEQFPDHKGINAGTNFPEEIQKAIEDCRVFLFALSRNSLQSDWCKKELTLAQECGKTILPILIEPGDIDEQNRKNILKEIESMIPPELINIHRLDLSGTMEGKERLLPDWLKKHGLYRNWLSRQTAAWLACAFTLGVFLGIVLPLIIRSLTPSPPTPQELKSLIDRETEAVLKADAEGISAIYMDHAIIEDADPNGRIWHDAMAYYAQNRLNLFYCQVEHNNFEIVILTTNYARVSTSSEGAFGYRGTDANGNCSVSYNNPRVADIWEFVRNDYGQWRISRFTFNAHRK